MSQGSTMTGCGTMEDHECDTLDSRLKLFLENISLVQRESNKKKLKKNMNTTYIFDIED